MSPGKRLIADLDRAVGDGVLRSFTVLHRSRAWPRHGLTRPVVALLNDADGGLAIGPASWSPLPAALAWARGNLVVVDAGQGDGSGVCSRILTLARSPEHPGCLVILPAPAASEAWAGMLQRVSVQGAQRVPATTRRWR